MNAIADERQESEPAVAAYKRLLRTYLDRRPSGTRQRLAAALGTHKSFISQVTNPSYRVPLPAQHVLTIFKICHFSPEEQGAFLDAYRRAHGHPPLAETADAPVNGDVLHIAIPPMANADRRRQVIRTIEETAAAIIALAQKTEEDDR